MEKPVTSPALLHRYDCKNGSVNSIYLPLDEILYRLLFDSSFRGNFTRGNWAELPISPSDYGQLRTVDLDELSKMAKLVGRNMLYGTGGGNLTRSFPRTFTVFAAAGLSSEDIIDQFTVSDEFRQSRELPFAGVGLSLEEAFYNFASGNRALSAAFHEPFPWGLHEFLTALFAILVTSPEPNFEIGTSLVRRNHACRYAVVSYPCIFIRAIRGLESDEPAEQKSLFLYAAANRSLVRGPIPHCAENIISGCRASTPARTSHNDVVGKDADKWMRHFIKLGLI